MAPLPSLVGGALTQKYVSGPCVFPNLMRHALRRLLPAHLQPMYCQNSVSSPLSIAGSSPSALGAQACCSARRASM